MDTSRAPHLRVPVLFRDPVQTAEHDGQDLVDVLLDQAQDVLVVPEVERPLGHLTAEERDVGTEQRRDLLDVSAARFGEKVILRLLLWTIAT